MHVIFPHQRNRFKNKMRNYFYEEIQNDDYFNFHLEAPEYKKCQNKSFCFLKI